MGLKVANIATSVLAGAIATGSGQITVAAGHGAKFPTLGDGDWFPLTVLDGAGNCEIMRCTARDVDLLTVSRAQEGTVALAFAAGDRVDLRLTAAAMAIFMAAGDWSARTITGADTIVAADLGKTLLVNSNVPVTLAVTAAATLGVGFQFTIRNVGAALVTIDPNGTETMDDKSKMTVGLGEVVRVVCDGTSFHTDASRGKMVELGRVTNPNTAPVDFDFASGWPADFGEFEIHLIEVTPSIDDVYLGMRIKTGALVVATAGYAYAGRVQGTGGGADTGSATDAVTNLIALTRVGATLGIGGGIGESCSGVITFSRPGVSMVTQVRFVGSYSRSDGITQGVTTYGYYGSNSAWTGVRLFMSGGNILSGTIVLYGRRK